MDLEITELATHATSGVSSRIVYLQYIRCLSHGFPPETASQFLALFLCTQLNCSCFFLNQFWTWFW